MRVTLADLQNPAISNIAANVGIDPSTPDFIALANEAQQRLLYEGNWWGTCSEIRICATDGCITLPRQAATVLKASVCSIPIPTHDFWFRYLRNGIGLRRGSLPECNSVGQFPTFSDIQGSASKLLAICDVAEDVDMPVLYLGYDTNGNWIRTRQNGVWQDGEVVSLSQSPGTMSVNTFSKVTDIQYPKVMQGQSWLYEYASNATKRLIGQYDNDNIRPSFRRVTIPSIKAQSLQTDSSGNPIPVSVDLIVKLEFIPAVQPTDYMMIGNIPALNEMCMALNKSGNEADGIKSNQILLSGTATACRTLDKELNHYLGDGRDVGVDIQGSLLADACAVENFI